MKPGYYEVNFDASLLSSGIYFYRIQADDPSTSSGQGLHRRKNDPCEITTNGGQNEYTKILSDVLYYFNFKRKSFWTGSS